MPSHDLYVEYLSNLHRDELRLMARNQNITGFSRMDRPELIVKLIDAKVQRASAAVINQARLWNQGLIDAILLRMAIDELESLHVALRDWERRWEQTLPKEDHA